MKTFVRLFCLFCISSLNAFAGQWTKQLEFKGSIESIHFASERLGLAAGWEYARGHVVIYRTADAGQHWQKVFADSGSHISQVRFSDELHAWALGTVMEDGAGRPLILRSSDGGLNWIRQSVPEHSDPFSIAVLDSNRMIMTGRTFVLASDDAGSTWRELWKDSSVNLGSVRYAASDTIVINGMTLESPHKVVVVTSADRGKTWTKSISEYRHYGEYFLDGLNAYTTNRYYFLKTHDAGITWDTVYYDSSRALYTEFSHRMHFTDRLNGWVVGATAGPYTILHTRDGGYNWRQDPSALGMCNRPMNVWFAKKGSGWIVGEHETWQGKDRVLTAIIMHYSEATGVEEEQRKEEDFPVFVQGNSLELHPAAGGRASYSLHDVLGNMLLQGETEMPGTLDISAIPDGVYFVTLESGASIFRKKICIAR